MKLTYKPQYTILISTIVLAVIGIVMIYSASCYSAEINYNDAYFFVKKQAIAFGAGTVVMIFACVLNLEILKKLKWIILVVSVVLLAIVFIPNIGTESYGAKRWINLGFVTFQPSEIAKFGLIIFLAGYMAEHPPVTLKKILIPLLAGGIVCLLIIMEPNMSITMCVGMALVLVLYIGGSPRKLFVLMVVLVMVAVPVLIAIEPYRIKRILAFVNPWENPKSEGYQLIQSYYALGSGGMFGVGLFRSRQKYLFLPFAENDFIFSVIGEELGLVGCIFVIALFAVLIFSGIQVAMKAKNKYHTMLATGLTAIIALQTIINIAVVSGSIPPTGVPLPYVSAGGSSLMVFMFVSGLLYNISSVTNRDLSP